MSFLSSSGVAHRQLRGDLGDREAGGLGGQRRGARHPRFISMTIMRPSSGLIANCTFEPPVSTPISRSTAIEALRRIWYSLSVSVCAGATVMESPVYAHRIEVLDRAHDDAVVRVVAHHLHLVLLPADQRFLDQKLVGRGWPRTALADLDELFHVVGDAAAGAAEGEGRTDDGREADTALHLQRLFHAVGDGRTRRPRPMRVIASLNLRRSSALSMAPARRR